MDDEASLMTMFQILLKLLNYTPSVHTHPRAALAALEQNPGQFDLVITDLTMPEMNGLDLARQIRARRLDLPVILLTGFGANLSAEDLKEAGICELLEKPISLNTLADALQRALPGN